MVVSRAPVRDKEASGSAALGRAADRAGGGGRLQAQRFWHNQFHLYRLWILERRAKAVVATPARGDSVAPGVELHFLDRHARRDWVCQRGGDADWPQFRVALQLEHDLVLARRGDALLGWAWIGYERVFLPALGCEIRLAPDTAYFYDAYVRPAARGQGIGRDLVRMRCERVDDRRIERVLSHVLVGNEASLRALRVHGFETIGKTLFVRALALKLWTRQPLPTPRAA